MTVALHVRSFLLFTVAAIALPAQTFAAPVNTAVLAPITIKADKEDEEVKAEDLTVKDAGNIDTALRVKPGVYTYASLDNPGVSVNIRGLQGVGRVNSTIDGVPQTARNYAGHAGSFDPLVFIDPGLISSVNVTKGAVSGARGLGTLGGAADFRTLQFDDVLREGRNTGGLFRLGTGTNGKDASATLAGATRFNTSSGGTFGVLGALSAINESAYKDGKGNVARDGNQFSLSNGQRPRTWLLKSEYSDSDFGKLTFSAMGYRNNFLSGSLSSYYWAVDQKSVSVDYQRDGLSAKLWWVENDITFPAATPGDARLPSYGIPSAAGRRGIDTGKGFDVSNRSELTVRGVPVALTYGLAYNQSSYDGNEKAGSNPDGSLTKSGVFVGAEADLGATRLTGELRYDHWKTEGGTDYKHNPVTTLNGGRSGGKVGGRLRGDYAINEATGVHVEVSKTMRPPTASEMFFPSMNGGEEGGATQVNNNPNLRPETAFNTEIGLTHQRGPFNLSATVFNNRIKDYISYGTDSSDDKLRWMNMRGTTNLKGLELASRYDNGAFYVGASVTLSKTAKLKTGLDGFGATPGMMPGVYGTLDVGGRWMDGALTAGARVRHTGKTSAFIDFPMPDSNASQDIRANTLLDLYANWQVNDALHVYANVENATDRFFLTANANMNDTKHQFGGRGRTITIGGALKF